MNDGFGYWLAGLTDGEGCFYIATRRRASGNMTYKPMFLICLRDDDLAVLRECQGRTGVGAIRKITKGRNGANPIARWEVGTQAECLRLVELFDAYPLRSKKARDYAIWRRAVLAWTSIEPGHRWRGLGDYSALGEAKDELTRVRAYAAPDWSARPCPHGDPACPCQDGDPCHYEDAPESSAMPSPVLAP